MSEFKGTPGPWKWESEYFGLRQKTEAGGAWILKPEPWEGMHMAYPSETRAANARLIAAAPELLKALERLVIEITLSDVDMEYIDSHFMPHIEKARAAIARALGE